MITTLLGGLTPKQFLAEYWQKKPLLVRQALPGFKGIMERDALLAMALDDEIESRLVRRHGEQWEVRSGPQRVADLRRKREPWTVLVQGVNLSVEAGDALMRNFSFIPQARLDDLMVSYATDGGGVGPHFDNYDVFLLQGTGKRHWRISDQRDRRFVEDAPLRILADFRPTQEWVLEPGDMLYLPPHWAHDGIAVGECTTYSIGFRAPTAQELSSAFLDWLHDHLETKGIYADPDLEPAVEPARIGASMIDQVADMLAQVRWDRSMVAEFLGSYLSEPKAHVFFDPPDSPLTRKRFVSGIALEGCRLDVRTQLLHCENALYLNGDRLDDPCPAGCELLALANDRCLPAESCKNATLAARLHDLYIDGFLHIGERP